MDGYPKKWFGKVTPFKYGHFWYPAPPDMYETLRIMGYLPTSTGFLAGFLNHQQYVKQNPQSLLQGWPLR